MRTQIAYADVGTIADVHVLLSRSATGFSRHYGNNLLLLQWRGVRPKGGNERKPS